MQDREYRQNKELTALMQSYQKFFAEAYQKYLMESIHDSAIGEDPHEMIQAAVEDELNKLWYTISLNVHIPDLKPSEMMPQPEASVEKWLETLDDEQHLISLALHAATICDDTMPIRILIKLYESGEKVRNKLREICLDTDWSWNDDQSEAYDEQKSRNQQVCYSLMNVLGQWQSEETMKMFLNKFIDCDRPDDRISEAVGLYLINMGPEAISLIISTIEVLLDQDPDRQLAHEYLMMAITAIGQTEKSDEIFSVLRKSFRKMENPLIAAACIGDYGDPRGIRVLRSWLEQRLPAVAPALFQEMSSAIKRLGGDLDGLVHPMFPQTDSGIMS